MGLSLPRCGGGWERPQAVDGLLRRRSLGPSRRSFPVGSGPGEPQTGPGRRLLPWAPASKGGACRLGRSPDRAPGGHEGSWAGVARLACRRSRAGRLGGPSPAPRAWTGRGTTSGRSPKWVDRGSGAEGEQCRAEAQGVVAVGPAPVRAPLGRDGGSGGDVDRTSSPAAGAWTTHRTVSASPEAAAAESGCCCTAGAGGVLRPPAPPSAARPVDCRAGDGPWLRGGRPRALTGPHRGAGSSRPRNLGLPDEAQPAQASRGETGAPPGLRGLDRREGPQRVWVDRGGGAPLYDSNPPRKGRCRLRPQNLSGFVTDGVGTTWVVPQEGPWKSERLQKR